MNEIHEDLERMVNLAQQMLDTITIAEATLAALMVSEKSDT